MSNRRTFLKCSGLTFLAASTLGKVHADSPQQLFSEKQKRTISIVGNAFVPGSGEAGLADFIESQLAVDPQHSLLMIRYVGVAPPYRDFYLSSIDAVAVWAERQYGQQVEKLSRPQLDSLIADLAGNNPDNFTDFPAALFYFVFRADAMDVVYGTKSGFARLGIPYMAHIEPRNDW